ncbi:MAG: DNA-directed DNA polymerase II small subunit [archaeon]
MTDDILEKKKALVALLMQKGIMTQPDTLTSLASGQDLDRLFALAQQGAVSSKDLIDPASVRSVLEAEPSHRDSASDASRLSSPDATSDASPDTAPDMTPDTAPDNTPNPAAPGIPSEGYSSVTLPEKLSIPIPNPELGAPQPHEAFPLNIITSYREDSKKREVKDFVAYFNARYQAISSMLVLRHELSNPTSIARLQGKPEKERVAFIGVVMEVKETKNKNILITIDDPSGKTTVLVSNNNRELLTEAKTLVPDEVIGFSGVIGRGLIYADNIIWPDIPLTKELKKSPDEVYAIFLSDVHVGSKEFIEDKFDRFIEWINGRIGNPEQREMVSKIGYAFIIGDLVDGIGVYPNQQAGQNIPDIYAQYKRCAELFARLPKHINIIVSPGNHDALRLAEPQPAIPEDIAPDLWALPNVKMVSNPAWVNINQKDGFPGFDVLIYHGYSFDHYIAHVEDLRLNHGYDRPDLIMKFLLKRRHLGPTHTSRPYIPSAKDSLVIDRVPDFFISGHIHKTSISDYRNITMVCSSCWQSKTDFQEKVGHHPEPARVPLVNLQTREVKILKF